MALLIVHMYFGIHMFSVHPLHVCVHVCMRVCACVRVWMKRPEGKVLTGALMAVPSRPSHPPEK